jgi:hypothetical protein
MSIITRGSQTNKSEIPASLRSSVGFAASGRTRKDVRYTLMNLVTNGNFAIDTSGDGFADSWINSNITNYSIVNNVQLFTATLANYAGLAARFIIMNKALTQSEITQLFNLHRAEYGV